MATPESSPPHPAGPEVPTGHDASESIADANAIKEVDAVTATDAIAEPAGSAAAKRDAATGIYLFGVVRGGGRGDAPPMRGLGPEVQKVRFRELVALARAAPFRPHSLEERDLIEHQRAVERIMRRGTILPAPPGVVFRGRRPLLKFLEDQYLAMEEGLIFLDGHWELRLHITSAVPGAAADELTQLAAHTYAELRRLTRAAVPFPRDGRRLLSAGFLVEKGRWIEFIERAEDLGSAHPELALDVTGPWPPYDFVRMVV